MRKAVIVSAVILLVLSSAHTASAAKGFRIGTGFGPAFPVFVGDVVDVFTPNTGFAWEVLELGYGFNEHFSLNVRGLGAVGGTDISNVIYTFAQFGLDARYAFLTDQRVNPYLMLGIGSSDLVIAGEGGSIEYDPGFGVDLGGGFDYFFSQSRRWSIGSRIYFHYVEYHGASLNLFDTFTIPLDVDTAGGLFIWTFNIAYTFRPRTSAAR